MRHGGPDFWKVLQSHSMQTPQLLSQLVQMSAGRCSRGLGNKLEEAFWKSTPEAVPGEEQRLSVVQPGCLDVLLEEWVFSGSGVGLAGLGSASWLSVHSGTGPVSSGLLSHPHPSAVLFFPTSSPQQFLLLTLQLSTLSAFLPLWIKTAHLRGVGG